MHMKHLALLLLLTLSVLSKVQAQDETSPSDYRFPLVISLQFHGFTMPFKNLSSNFRNVGLGIGTELSLNSTNTWVQQVQAVWFRNKAIGNGLLLYSQNVWRPTIESFFAEVKFGAGYLYSFRPGTSYESVNGRWMSAGRRGKGMLALPLGITAGSYTSLESSSLAPFVSYQFMLVKGYNTSIPIVPQTLLQTGVLIGEKK